MKTPLSILGLCLLAVLSVLLSPLPGAAQAEYRTQV